MSRSLFELRALTVTASLLAGSAAALGQDQKPTEEDHGQQQPGNDPQDHSQHDMSRMAGMTTLPRATPQRTVPACS